MSSTGYSERPAVPVIGQRRWRDRSGDVSASEPVTVFALKSLLYPIIPVITLIACLFYFNQPLYGPYLLIAVLSFLGVADLLDVVPIRITPAYIMALRSLFDIWFRWGVLMTFLWTLLRLSGLSIVFSPSVLKWWAILTPFVLWIGELGAQHMLQRSNARSRQMRKAVIVGANSLGVQLEQNIAGRPALQIHVAGYFEDRSVPRLPSECVDRILGRLSELSDFV